MEQLDSFAEPKKIDAVHTNQKQIDCLDFLIYSLKTGKLEG